MSYPQNRYVRQPGGFAHGRCTPQPWNGIEPLVCDCYICRNDGRPDHVVINFLNFAENATHDNNDCACLNLNNTTLNPDQTVSGPNSVYSNGVFQGWKLDYTGTFCGAIYNVDPTATCSTGVTCLFEGALHPSIFGLGGAHGLWARVELGWTQAVGIFVYAEFGDPPNDPNSLIYPYYTWLKTGLPETPGNVICHSDGGAKFAPNSIGNLLFNATSGAWTKTYEFYSATTVGGSGKNYLCGPAVTGQSQNVTCGISFVGSTKTSPPCCCGDQTGDTAGEWNRPFFACFGSTDPACPIGGLLLALFPAGPNHWTGSGAIAGSSTVNAALSYDPAAGLWTFTFDCGGTPTTLQLTATGAAPNLTLTGTAASNGCCSGPIQISVSSAPGYCPGPTLSNEISRCGCAPGVTPPLELLVTLPSPGQPAPNQANPGCDAPPKVICKAIGGNYAVQYQGYVAPNGGDGGYCLYSANFPLPNFTYTPGGDPANGTGTYKSTMSLAVRTYDSGAVTVLMQAPANADCGLASATWSYPGPAQADCANYTLGVPIVVNDQGIAGGLCIYHAADAATVSPL